MRDMGVKAVTCPICPMLRRVMTRWSIDEGGVQCVFASTGTFSTHCVHGSNPRGATDRR